MPFSSSGRALVWCRIGPGFESPRGIFLFGSALATVFGVCCVMYKPRVLRTVCRAIRHGMRFLCTCHDLCTSPKQTTSVQQELQLVTVLEGVFYMACASRCMISTYRDPAHRRNHDDCMLCTSCYTCSKVHGPCTPHTCVCDAGMHFVH